MKYVTYIIPGPPIPQPRGRLRKAFGAQARIYDPRSKDKQRIRTSLLAQRLQYNQPLLQGPLYAEITFFMPIPKSLSKKKQLALIGKPHISKPDRDNLEKLLLDCCSKSILILDDCLVYWVNSKKIYDLNPRTEFYFVLGAENEEKTPT